MCLAVPGKLVQRIGLRGQMEFRGVIREVALELVPEAREGDYVLVHAGCAVQILNPQEAGELLSVFEELDEVSHVRPNG